jgi:hypothetical protein
MASKGTWQMRNALLLGSFCALLAGVSAGCGPTYLPNTEIEDTDQNKEIVSFCERYRHAVEDLNVGLILSLTSPRYFDNSGTPTGDDDYDRRGLEEVLKARFRSVRSMRYEIKYRNLYERDGLFMIDYTYTMSFEYEIGGKTKWANKTAENRLEIEKVEGGYLIVAGL